MRVLAFVIENGLLRWAVGGSSFTVARERDFCSDSLADTLSEFLDTSMEIVSHGGILVHSRADRDHIATLLTQCRMPYLLGRWNSMSHQAFDDFAQISTGSKNAAWLASQLFAHIKPEQPPCQHKPRLLDNGPRDNGEYVYVCSTCGRNL